MKNPDLYARRKVETNEEAELIRGEGKKPDVQRLQQSQTLKCRKENEAKAECRSVQCRSSDDGR